MRELKRLVEDRELGRILHIEGHFSNESTGRFFTGWRGSGVESPGGGLTATGIHVIDAFMGLVGPAQRVTAHSVSHESLSAPVDTLTVFMEMANRVSGVLCGVRTTPQFWRVHVFGENGSAEAIEDVDVVVRKNRYARTAPQLRKGRRLATRARSFCASGRRWHGVSNSSAGDGGWRRRTRSCDNIARIEKLCPG
jgi:predicted dehydrogenase